MELGLGPHAFRPAKISPALSLFQSNEPGFNDPMQGARYHLEAVEKAVEKQAARIHKYIRRGFRPQADTWSLQAQEALAKVDYATWPW